MSDLAYGQNLPTVIWKTNLISELDFWTWFLSILLLGSLWTQFIYVSFYPSVAFTKYHDFSPYMDFHSSRFPDFLISYAHLQSYYLSDHALSFFTYLFWSISHRAMITCHTFFSLFFYLELLKMTNWWCPRVESSLVFGTGCLLWPVHSLGKSPLAFDLFHSVLQGQICLLLQVFLYFLLLHCSPLKWKGHLFWVLVLKGLVGLHRTVQLQLLQR